MRGDVSFVHAINLLSGDAFGIGGTLQNQPRTVAEIGFMFGNNITAKKS